MLAMWGVLTLLVRVGLKPVPDNQLHLEPLCSILGLTLEALLSFQQ